MIALIFVASTLIPLWRTTKSRNVPEVTASLHFSGFFSLMLIESIEHDFGML